MLLTIGERDEIPWTTAHCSTVRVVTPYENVTTIMHEGASGGGKSEMLEAMHREADGRIRLGTNVVTGETRWLTWGENLIPHDMQANHFGGLAFVEVTLYCGADVGPQFIERGSFGEDRLANGPCSEAAFWGLINDKDDLNHGSGYRERVSAAAPPRHAFSSAPPSRGDPRRAFPDEAAPSRNAREIHRSLPVPLPVPDLVRRGCGAGAIGISA